MYQSQEVAMSKLEKGPLRGYETAFCSHLALKVLEKILKNLLFLLVFGLSMTLK
jgi:hypothetical protein